MFRLKWDDDALKSKSKRMIEEFASAKGFSVFAAATGVSTLRLAGCEAVRCGFPTFAFDATSAFVRADEDEMVFLEPPLAGSPSRTKREVWGAAASQE